MVRWSRVRRGGWRDHVDRMKPEPLAEWSKTELPLGTKQPPGRPSKRWREIGASTPEDVQSRL